MVPIVHGVILLGFGQNCIRMNNGMIWTTTKKQAIWLINEPGIVESAVNRFHISRLVPETVFESIKT